MFPFSTAPYCVRSNYCHARCLPVVRRRTATVFPSAPKSPRNARSHFNLSIMPVANGFVVPNGLALEADPDTKAEVDLMILDYLASIATERILHPADTLSEETKQEIDWLVDSVRAFQSLVVTAQSDNPLPQDVDIKLRILRVADALWIYTPAPMDPSSERSPRLSSIGLEFMDLCTTAISRVSETRWFDIGAQFLIQAALEEHCEGNTPSDTLYQFTTWTPSDPTRNTRWMKIRQRYVGELPGPEGLSAVRDSLVEKFPFVDFKASALVFLFDLMATLDPPLLMQLERGQLGELSRVETQRLKGRIGMH